MKLYLSLAIVFLLSFLGAWLLPINDIFKGIFATPALLAMIGALFQLTRDHAAYENKLDLQRKQQIFNLGATSHMANVTFDKHVEFCEQYMSEVDSTIATLYHKGPTEIALEHASQLNQLRNKYSAWITEDIGTQLAPFEDALRGIGAWEGYVQKTSADPSRNEKRNERIEYVHQTFCKVLDIGHDEQSCIDSEKIDEYISGQIVKNRIRQILNIEDLVNLRKALIAEAYRYLKST